MLFASHHTSNLMISHILLFLTTLKNLLRLLSAGWAEEGTFPLTGSNNSSGWEESGRLQTADGPNIWTSSPPFHNLNLNLKQRSHMKNQERCKDTGELQKVMIFLGAETIFSADPEPSAARHCNTSLGCWFHNAVYNPRTLLFKAFDLILANTLF